MVDSFSSIDTGRDTSLSSGFLDFTEEEKKRMEQLGYDLQKVESSINSGEFTKDDMLISMASEENEFAEQAEREVQREEAGMPPPPNRFMPATVDYQDAPQQQKGFSWDNFFSTNTGPGDFLASTVGDTGEFFGTIVGYGIEALGRATNNEDIYLAGKNLKEYTVDKSRAFKDWGMDEGAKADALGPRSIFTYDKPDDSMPSGLGNFNLGTLTQLFGSVLSSSAGILLPAKLITKKLIKKGMSPKLASGIGIGTSAGFTEGTMAASDAYDNAIEFSRKNPDLVKNSPIYNDVRKEILAQFPNASEEDLFTFITDEIAESASLWAGVPAGTLTGISSGIMLGPFFHKIGFLGKGAKKFDGVRKPWGKALYGGAWREGGEEAFQEGQTQLWANFAEYKSGKSPDKLSGKGVAEAVGVGLLGGGMAGKAFGAVGNYGMPTQQEVDRQRDALMYEWMDQESQLPQPPVTEALLPDPTSPQETPQIKSPFTTTGSDEYLGDKLEALGLEFDEGQSFAEVAARNNIDVKKLEDIKVEVDKNRAEREGAELDVDTYSDEGQAKLDKGTVTTGKKPFAKLTSEEKINKGVESISGVVAFTEAMGSSEDITFSEFAEAYVSQYKETEGKELDPKQLVYELRRAGVVGIKNDGSSTIGDIVRATHAKHPELKLDEKFPQFLKETTPTPTAKAPPVVKAPSVAKVQPTTVTVKPLSKARIKRLKDINVRLAGRIKEEEVKKKPSTGLISELNRQIKANEGFLEKGTEEVVEETEAKKEPKQVGKKVEAKKKPEAKEPRPPQKAIDEASAIVDEFGTVEEVLKRTTKANAVTVQKLKDKLIGLKYKVGVVRGWKKERLAKELWKAVGKLRGEKPSLIDSASSLFMRNLAKASALENLRPEEVLTIDGNNALIIGEAFEKIKAKYLKEISRIRGLGKKASIEETRFMNRWEQALRDVSGKAGFVERKFKNPKTGEVRIEYKVVWHGSPEDVKMRATATRVALKKIRDITNTRWDLGNLFTALKHKDPKVRKLAEQLLAHDNANSEMRLRLFAPYTGQKIIESVLDGHSSLSAPDSSYSRVDLEIMYTRIMNTIDRVSKGSGPTSMKWVLPQEQFDLFENQKGEGKFIEVPLTLTLDEKNELDTLRAEAASLSDTIFDRYGTRPKRIKYEFFNPDAFYFRAFEKISNRFFGDGKKKKGVVGREKENISNFIKDKKDKFAQYKKTQLSKASSPTDKLTKKEAERLIDIEEGNIAKSITDHMDIRLPVIIDAYEQYYAGLRENGFNLENLRPILFEDFTEQELKEENKKVSAARADFTSKLKNLFHGNLFIGRAGLYAKTGWTATPEEKDIYSTLIRQQLDGEGDEILTVADFTAINDHYHLMNTTGHGGKMDLARLKNLGYNARKYDPTQEERGGGWKTVLRKKPAVEVLDETKGMSESEFEVLLKDQLKPEIDRVGKVLEDIYRDAWKKGLPLIRYEKVEEAAGVEGKTLIGWYKGKGIWKPTEGSPVKKKTVIVPVTKKMKVKGGKDKVIYERKRAREWIPETRTVTKKIYKSSNPEDYVWEEMEVYTGKADESAPLAFEREYEIIHLEDSTNKDKTKNKVGKKEFRRLDNMPVDVYVKDIYVEKIDDNLQKKIDDVIRDDSLHRDERSAKLNKLLAGRKEITETAAGKTVQVVDEEETKKRGTKVYKEEEVGVAIPFNSFRRTYEKVLNKRKPMRNSKGKEVHDDTGSKMYHEDWNYRDAKDDNGEPIPRLDIVWEEVEEWDGEPEHPFLEKKKLNEEQKALGRFKESRRWVVSKNSGWHAVNAYGKTVIPVKGVSKLIMDQINPPKPEMSESEADAYARKAYKKNLEDGKDHFNRTRTHMILDSDAEEVKDIVRRRSSLDGHVIGEFVKSINPSDGSVMLRPVKTGLTDAIEQSKIVGHPQTGRDMKIYNLRYSREGVSQGDLIYRDNPLKHISFETTTTTGTKKISVIAEDGTMEGTLLGTIVLVRNEQGVEEISLVHFDTPSLRTARVTREQVDKLVGHVLGVYVAKQPTHYTGVDLYATGLGVKPHMSQSKKELLGEIASKTPPVGERFLGYVSTAKGMNESARNAFTSALFIESEASKIEQQSTFSRVNPDTGEYYETGGRWFTGEFGMDEIVPETEVQRRNRMEKKWKPMLKPMLLALTKKYRLKKLQPVGKWLEKHLDTDEITEAELEKAEDIKRKKEEGDVVSREGEMSVTGLERKMTQEEEELISKAEEGKTEEEKAEQRFYYEKALAIEDEIESIENVEKSGEQLTPQQDAFKEMFKAIGGANKFKEILGGKHPEKALELIVDIYSGISMNQGKEDTLDLSEVSPDPTGEGLQKEIDDSKDRGGICYG